MTTAEAAGTAAHDRGAAGPEAAPAPGAPAPVPGTPVPGAEAAPAPGPSGSAPDPAPAPDPDHASGPLGRWGAFRLRYPMGHTALVATAVAAVLHLVWFLFIANSGGDLAAQDAWAEFVGRHPDSAYNLAWYGGMHPVSYSVVSPYLMSLLGVRTTMMIAGTASAGLLALVLCRCRGAVRSPLPPALAGVFALFCNAVSGRVTFGLGVMFALGAVAAVFCWPRKWARNRWGKAAVAAPLAGLATAASPVAGLFLGVIAAALFLSGRRPGAFALGLAPVVVVGLSAWLFPFSGTQPISLGSASLPFLFAVLVLVLVPAKWKTVRIASGVYAAGVFLTWLVDSQVGSNVTRLAMLFAGVALLAALPYTVPRSLKWYAVLLAFLGLNSWITANSVMDVIRTTPKAAWARELAPLVDRLQQAGADRGRVEVVPVSSHRESSALAPYVNLARGWNRQADLERNPLFYDDTLTAEGYRSWLDRWAVHYVVLPADRPDSGGVREAELIGTGLPYLARIWGDENWQLFRVQAPTPLADPPAEVSRAAAEEVVVQVTRPGPVLIRVPYSPWLGLVDAEGKGVTPPTPTENPAGCLYRSAPDEAGVEWTTLLAPGPGEYRLAAPYQLPRGTACPEELLGDGTSDGTP